jgi:hypothetical protein
MVARFVQFLIRKLLTPLARPCILMHEMSLNNTNSSTNRGRRGHPCRVRSANDSAWRRGDPAVQASRSQRFASSSARRPNGPRSCRNHFSARGNQFRRFGNHFPGLENGFSSFQIHFGRIRNHFSAFENHFWRFENLLRSFGTLFSGLESLSERFASHSGRFESLFSRFAGNRSRFRSRREPPRRLRSEVAGHLRLMRGRAPPSRPGRPRRLHSSHQTHK